jgi:hypothetical protein|tara:strand:- start:1265 stop:1462 length:198 start_codon:yes stop_codon:yes gene_type:complete
MRRSALPAIAIAAIAIAHVGAVTDKKPVDFILDTDFSIDVDDVGALCIAHALTDNGTPGESLSQT